MPGQLLPNAIDDFCMKSSI